MDAIDFPVDMTSTYERRFDDFARYRQRWGGIHTGSDLAFDQTGDPVRASMRGRVTLSNPTEWNTELGVVVLQHVMPDNSTVYSVYGHMMESAVQRFPPVGTCLERGDIVGLIGDPSLSRPHLHYEIRTVLAFEGGPGYVNVNPVTLGWLHAINFTYEWQARFRGLVSAAIHLDQPPTLPILLMENGGLAYARDDQVIVLAPTGDEAWRIGGEDRVVALAHLSGDRLVVRTLNGTLEIVQNGRVLSRWNVDALDSAIATIGDVIIVSNAQNLTGYTPEGVSLWILPAESETVSLQTDESMIVWAAHDANGLVRWQSITPDGAVRLTQYLVSSSPVTTPIANGWAILDGDQVYRIINWEVLPPVRLPISARLSTTIAASPNGDLFVYAGDFDRTLLAVTADGQIRWRIRYPSTPSTYAPLMGVGSGCALFTLDADGLLNVFSAADGTQLDQAQFYAGGNDTAQPQSRFMQVFENDQLVLNAGFLSAMLLNGASLTGETCP